MKNSDEGREECRGKAGRKEKERARSGGQGGSSGEVGASSWHWKCVEFIIFGLVGGGGEELKGIGIVRVRKDEA